MVRMAPDVDVAEAHRDLDFQGEHIVSRHRLSSGSVEPGHPARPPKPTAPIGVVGGALGSVRDPLERTTSEEMSRTRNQPDPTPSPDLLVIGAGVIGLAIARELLAAGRRVTLLERSEPGRAASWAAAGMLSPLGEALEPGPFLRFALEGLEAYPAFAAELEDETGIEVELRHSGKLRVALSHPEAERLRARHAWAVEHGHRTAWLEPDSLAELEPGLTGALGALRLDEDLRIDNRQLARALAASVEARGGRLHRHTEVEEILHAGGRVHGVRLAGGERLECPRVLLAAGAWCGRLSGRPDAVPVRPVRGQMLALRPEPLPSPRVLESEEVYLVPRDDGRLLVGATEEEAGFDPSLTAVGVQRILAGAIRLVPALAGAPIDELWTGFRPGTPDGFPILGADPEIEGLYLATGHFRNGILLTPATARAMATLLEEGRADSLPPEFAPTRFARDPAGRG